MPYSKLTRRNFLKTVGAAAVAADFLARLQEIIAHCQTSEGGFTPSDFPLLEGGLNF